MLSEHIKEILEDRVLVRPTDGKVILRERQASMEFEVADMPPSVTTIDINQLVGRRGGSLPGVRNGPWKRHCDYLLVCEAEDGEIAIFVELKKTLNQDKRRGIDQLRRSLPLLEYLRSVCRVHSQMKTATSKVHERYFLIGEKNDERLDKQLLRPNRPLPTEAPENIKVNTFVGPRVRFDLLRSA